VHQNYTLQDLKPCSKPQTHIQSTSNNLNHVYTNPTTKLNFLQNPTSVTFATTLLLGRILKKISKSSKEMMIVNNHPWKISDIKNKNHFVARMKLC
jgi:hypothetical protein